MLTDRIKLQGIFDKQTEEQKFVTYSAIAICMADKGKLTQDTSTEERTALVDKVNSYVVIDWDYMDNIMRFVSNSKKKYLSVPEDLSRSAANVENESSPGLLSIEPFVVKLLVMLDDKSNRKLFMDVYRNVNKNLK